MKLLPIIYLLNMKLLPIKHYFRSFIGIYCFEKGLFIGPLPVGRVLNDLLASPEVIGKGPIEFFMVLIEIIIEFLQLIIVIKGD